MEPVGLEEPVEAPAEPWYREGLRFECTRCGNCCRGAGNVWIDDVEIARLAVVLEMDEAAFRAVYVRRAERAAVPARGRGDTTGDPGAVLRQKRDGDCVFFDAQRGCTVYDARPRQCCSYPFWSALVHARRDWEAESRVCPGIGRGDLHPAGRISATAARDGIPVHRSRLRTARS